MLRLRASIVIIAGVLCASTNAWAGDETRSIKLKAVVELFTSQGCSSCPPADALLQKYVEREDVIALSLPVDYWDYLGWKDTFAKAAYSDRQRRYARARGDGQVYTPQIVVNGRTHVVGSRQADIDAAIAGTSKALEGKRVPVSLHMEGESLVIVTGAAGPDAEIKSARILLALVQNSAVVDIRRGENGGRSVRYYNIVRDLREVARWNGKAETFRVANVHDMDPASDSCTVIIQQGTDGPILGAAELQAW